LSISQAYALGTTALAMIGLLLVGLAPVGWLFAVSTESIGFFVFLVLMVWLVVLAMSMRQVYQIVARGAIFRFVGVVVWLFIFMLVSFQMTTCFRPMLSLPKDKIWTTEKQFFLIHFGKSFTEGTRGENPGQQQNHANP
jgi:hypothetical protein